jgi:hypothetical protein
MVDTLKNIYIMSSYLTFYLQRKDEKPITLISYSRNDELYQYFYENINMKHDVQHDSEYYTIISCENVNNIISELTQSINNVNTRIIEYEKHVNGNIEIIDEIISLNDYLSTLNDTLIRVKFIKDLVLEADFGYADYTAVLCNIS